MRMSGFYSGNAPALRCGIWLKVFYSFLYPTEAESTFSLWVSGSQSQPTHSGQSLTRAKSDTLSCPLFLGNVDFSDTCLLFWSQGAG